jgi:hypothetical protein
MFGAARPAISGNHGRVDANQNLYRLVGHVSYRVTHRLPITAENVHAAALAWLIIEAHTGPTSDPDLDLIAVLDANPGAGDATAQAVCDAAARWRDQVGPGGGPNAGPFRRLLANAVDTHRHAARWRKHRLWTCALIPATPALVVAFGAVGMQLGWTHGALFTFAASVTVASCLAALAMAERGWGVRLFTRR